ncbi:MAG: radical SAM protein [Carboxylicivirga sp.]|nr:radical SAM protein [Carboxylicivirga sp.]
MFPSEKYGLLLYNSISNCFWQLDEVAKQNLMSLKEEVESGNYIPQKCDIHDNLIDAGIISTDAHEDVISKLKLEKKTQSFNFYDRTLLILPTTACNFDCSYCYEEHRPNVHMTDEVEDAIFKRYFEGLEKGVKYNITWYGGEPLMGFKRMEKITQRLIDSNIDFVSSIVTNGFLLNEGVISKLDDLRINVIQLTLDGDKETHDSRRYLLNKGGTYDKILENMKLLHSYSCIDSIDVMVRVNIDKQNSKKYQQLFEDLKEQFPKFNVYPGIVTNYEECNRGCLTNQNKIDLIKEGLKYGKEVLPVLPDFERNSGCMADVYFSAIVGPSGEIYKCLNDVGNKEKIIDHLLDESKLNIKVISRYLAGIDPYADKDCLDCLHLPRCNGGCPYEQYLSKFEDVKISPCTYFKDNMDSLLEMQYGHFLETQTK